MHAREPSTRPTARQFLILMVSLCYCAALVQAADDAPAPRAVVPDAAAQTKAEKNVRDVFGNHDKETPDERDAAAAKMLDAAATSQDEPATLYVLLKRSGDLAAGAGDADVAIKAAAKLSESFAMDGDDLALQWLRKAVLTTQSAAAAKSPGDAALAFAHKSGEAQKFDMALRALAIAETAAQTSKDLPLRNLVQSATTELKNLQTESVHAKAAQAKLEKNPDDTEASYILGRYQCLGLANWTAGLPAIGKGSNALFRQAATADLANPDQSAAEVAVGDLWWDLSERETGHSRTALKRRAASWYAKAQADPKLNGLARAKLEKRSALVLAAPESAGGAASISTGNHPRSRSVVYFPGTGREEEVFRKIGKDGFRALGRREAIELLANPNGLAGVGILVFGNEYLGETPPADLTDKVEANVRRFVGEGGDLVIFEQHHGDPAKFLEKLFKITIILKDARQLTAIPKDLAAAVQSAGLMTNPLRDSFNSCNLYTVPENSIIYYRSGNGDNTEAIVAAGVPFGKGRVIVIGNNMETSETPFNEQLLDYIYHYKEPAAGAKTDVKKGEK